MRQRRRILILTASYGDGHLQVSKALQHKFHANGVQEVRLIDLFQEAHPVMNSIAKFLYTKSTAVSAYGFDYYGWSYYMTRNMENDTALAKWINLLGIKKLVAVIKTERPDVVIGTFPFGGITEQLRKRGIFIPTVTVITDFTLHNRWLYSVPDKFYVATEDLKKTMVGRGIPEQRIAVSGIPVREWFYDDVPGWDAGDGRNRKKSVLIMAGAYPLRDMKKIAADLIGMPDVRIDIVCGRNEKLKLALESHLGRHPDVEIFGYVERVDELMRRSSCIVTKAGGITLSEAIQINVPMLVFKPFPGQERENARYLADKGAALVSQSVRELTAHVRKLLTDEQSRLTMTKNIGSLQTGHAAETIVHDVLRIVGGNSDASASTIA